MRFQPGRSKTYQVIVWPLLLLIFAACSKTSFKTETAFTVSEQVKLRNSTAPASRVVGELKSGDRVTITDKSKAEDGTPWVKVTGQGGEAGWSEARNFVKEETVRESQRLADSVKNTQAQASGKSKATLKLRLTPDRSNDDNVATLISSGVVMDIVARERKPRPASLTVESDIDSPIKKTEGKKPESKKTDASSEAKDIKYDEWYLVRLKDSAVLQAGWIYGGSVGLEIPAEIQYFASSGRKIVGWQMMATLHGNDSKSGEHYLVLERKIFNADDNADFDRVKVLAYDPSSRNYTTPFKEDINCRFPMTLNMEGTRGQFQIKTVDKNDQARTVTYAVEMLDGGRVKVKRLDE